MNDNIEKRTVAIFLLAAVFVVAASFFAPDLFRLASVPAEAAAQVAADTAGAFAAGFDNGRSLLLELDALMSENARLRAELKRQEGDAREIERLRGVIDLRWGKPELRLTEAKIAGESRGEFRRLFSFTCLEAEEGLLVMNEIGLVGMVTSFSNGLAEGMRIFDPGFSVGCAR